MEAQGGLQDGARSRPFYVTPGFSRLTLQILGCRSVHKTHQSGSLSPPRWEAVWGAATATRRRQGAGEMIGQQRRYQQLWMWIVCLGVLGMTLMGCGTSSAPTEHSQSTTIRVVFPNQQASLSDQDLPDTTTTSDRLPARVMRQAGSLARFLEVREAQAQALPSDIAALILRVTDAS